MVPPPNSSSSCKAGRWEMTNRIQDRGRTETRAVLQAKGWMEGGGRGQRTCQPGRDSEGYLLHVEL